MEREWCRRALDHALHLGAESGEVVLARDVNLDVEVAEGKLETLLLAEAIGVGVRVFSKEHRMGFAYTTAVEGGLDRVVGAAWQNALANEPDEHNVLPEGDAESDDDWSVQAFGDIPVPEKVGLCRELEEKTLAADARVTRVEHASYSDSSSAYTIANTRGLLRTYRNAHCTCSVVAAASEPGSDSEMGWEFDFGETFEALRRDWVAQRCAERATRGLGGRPCEGGAMPIVLDNYVATQFLHVVVTALMANNVLKGKSLFAGRVGDAIASEVLTIIDRNDLVGGMNRAPFDAEGVSAQRTVLLDRGALLGYLHNAYTAHKMGQPMTANAGRGGGFRSTPEVGATNCFIERGHHAPEALIEAAGTGLLVTEAMGVHTADPISGDFSFGVSGLKIEQGRVARPVRGVTVAGNIKDLLLQIRLVGNDLRLFGGYGAPSLLVSEVMVSGE